MKLLFLSLALLALTGCSSPPEPDFVEGSVVARQVEGELWHATYTAVQRGKMIEVEARGTMGTTSRAAALVLVSAYPPHPVLALYWIKPTGAVFETAMIGKFDVWLSFKVEGLTESVSVYDADGHHDVAVVREGSTRPGGTR